MKCKQVLKELIRLPSLVATKTIWTSVIVSLTRGKEVEISEGPKTNLRTCGLPLRAKTKNWLEAISHWVWTSRAGSRFVSSAATKPTLNSLQNLAIATTVKQSFLKTIQCITMSIFIYRAVYGGKVLVLRRQGRFQSFQIRLEEVPGPSASAVDQEQRRNAQQWRWRGTRRRGFDWSKWRWNG